jgi:hypothetical protein
LRHFSSANGMFSVLSLIISAFVFHVRNWWEAMCVCACVYMCAFVCTHLCVCICVYLYVCWSGFSGGGSHCRVMCLDDFVGEIPNIKYLSSLLAWLVFPERDLLFCLKRNSINST